MISFRVWQCLVLCKPLSHSEFIFVYGVRECVLTSLVYMYPVHSGYFLVVV